MFGGGTKTVRYKKFEKSSHVAELHRQAKATLNSGTDLRVSVRLPEGEDLHEWLAINTVDFFNQINLLYGSITDFCTPHTCPSMSAGRNYEYLWADGDKIKKPMKVSAPEYVDLLMTWIQRILDDDTVFPSRTDQQFPKNFVQVVKNVFKKLFRVYAHMYYSHFEKIVSLGEEAHLNTCFKHFYCFIAEFDLVDRKELAPLRDLIWTLVGDKI
eukprot:m51a1_g5608 putative mps1 binder-like protein (213) ;mRNA; f:709063-710165